MNFTVELKSSVSETVSAETPQEAIDKAKALHPGFRPDYIHNDDTNEGVDCVHCDGCGDLIMNFDESGCDDDGNEYCGECLAAIKEDMEKYPEQYLTDDE